MDTIKEINTIKKQLKVSTSKVKRLTYHCKRCKNTSDIVRITMLVTLESVYCSLLTSRLLDLNKKIVVSIYG